MGKELSEVSVLSSLSKKHDVMVSGRTIKVVANTKYDDRLKETIPNPNKRGDLGNGSWGYIDFLVNIKGYHVVRVESLDKRRR